MLIRISLMEFAKMHPIMSGYPQWLDMSGNRLFEISSAVTEGRRSTALGGAGRNNFPSFGCRHQEKQNEFSIWPTFD